MAATWMMADWQEEASVMAQDLQRCFKREASKKNPKSEYTQTMNALIRTKLC